MVRRNMSKELERAWEELDILKKRIDELEKKIASKKKSKDNGRTADAGRD